MLSAKSSSQAYTKASRDLTKAQKARDKSEAAFHLADRGLSFVEGNCVAALAAFYILSKVKNGTYEFGSLP